MQPQNRILYVCGIEDYMLLNSFWTVDIKKSQMFWPVLYRSQNYVSPNFSVPIIVFPSYSFENNWLSCNPFIFFKSWKQQLKYIYIQLQRKTEAQFETMSQIWELLKQKMFSDLMESCLNEHDFSSNFFGEL